LNKGSNNLLVIIEDDDDEDLYFDNEIIVEEEEYLKLLNSDVICTRKELIKVINGEFIYYSIGEGDLFDVYWLGKNIYNIRFIGGRDDGIIYDKIILDRGNRFEVVDVKEWLSDRHINNIVCERKYDYLRLDITYGNMTSGFVRILDLECEEISIGYLGLYELKEEMKDKMPYGISVAIIFNLGEINSFKCLLIDRYGNPCDNTESYLIELMFETMYLKVYEYDLSDILVFKIVDMADNFRLVTDEDIVNKYRNVKGELVCTVEKSE